jgi:hypothetical protein
MSSSDNIVPAAISCAAFFPMMSKYLFDEIPVAGRFVERVSSVNVSPAETGSVVTILWCAHCLILISSFVSGFASPLVRSA